MCKIIHYKCCCDIINNKRAVFIYSEGYGGDHYASSTIEKMVKNNKIHLYNVKSLKEIEGKSNLYKSSELYAIGPGVAEGFHVRAFVIEAGLAHNVALQIQTYYSSTKHIAKQNGTARKTRHIQLRKLYMPDIVKIGIIKITQISGYMKFS